MSERMLITKLVRNGDRADLYAKGHQWPDLKLFDLSDLADVGIDYTGLESGVEVPCRFWAVYELGEKRNKAGNPYKNVIALERTDSPATTTSTDTSAVVDELRIVRSLLETIIARLDAGLPGTSTPKSPEEEGESEPGPGDIDTAFPQYGDGTAPSGDNSAELEAFAAYQQAEGRAPQNVETLRQWYTGQNGN